MNLGIFITGTFTFRPEVNEATKQAIIKDIKYGFGAYVTYSDNLQECQFNIFSRFSDLEEDDIDELIKNHAAYLSYFSYSLWYLNDADVEKEFDKEKLQKLDKSKKANTKT